MDAREYTVYNFNMELRFTLNISRLINETGLKSSVCLTGLNENQIYLYYSVLKTVKTIEKKSGSIVGDIEFEKNAEIKSSLNIKLDSANMNSFIIKNNASANSIGYFDRQGKLLAENSLDLLKQFIQFDLTHQNDICFCDNLKRKIYFI